MEASQITSGLIDRLPEWEAEAEALERKARAVRQVVEGLKALNGDAAAILGLNIGPNGSAAVLPDVSKGPVGREAVRRLVAERPGVWKVSDLKDAARRRGFPISKMGVEKAVMRMVASGEAVKVGYGRYRFEGGAQEVMDAA